MTFYSEILFVKDRN